MRALLQEDFPCAQRLTLVLDNLNTHGPHSLYAAFPPQEAARLCARLRWQFTPKHASWLNMAEIELSVLSRQALAERPGNLAALRAQLSAWQARRNASCARVCWQFTTADARVRLRHFYPKTLPW